MNICQKCYWNNVDLVMHCERCGAGMLPPMVPERLQMEVALILHHGASVIPSERSSENDLTRATRLAELIGNQTVHQMQTSVTLSRLVTALDQAGLVNRRELRRDVRQEMHRRMFGQEQRSLLDARKADIFQSFGGQSRGRFTELVESGMDGVYTACHPSAMRLLCRALSLDPGNRPLMRCMAEIYFISGRDRRAAQILKKLIVTQPENPSAGVLLAMIFLKKGAPQKALPILESARRGKPESVAPRFLLGVVHFLRAEYHSAALYFRAIYTEKKIPEVNLLGAMALYLDRKAHSADLLSRQAEDELAGSGFFHLLRGLICNQRNWPRKARSHFLKASEQNERWASFLSRMETMDAERTQVAQHRLFVSRLHVEMRRLMPVLITEVQSMDDPPGANSR